MSVDLWYQPICMRPCKIHSKGTSACSSLTMMQATHSLRKFNTRWICLKYILQTVIWSDITILTPIRFHPDVPSRGNRVFYLLRWLMVTRVSYLYHNVLILYQQKIAVIPGIWGSVEMTFLRCAELTLYRCTMDLCIIIFLAT